MEGATLTVAIRDESSPGAGGNAATPQQGAPQQGPSLADQQQQAMTQAGGVGSYVTSRIPQVALAPVTTTVPVASVATMPVPQVTVSTPTTTADDRLSKFVSDLRDKDPSATAEEIARALGAQVSQVQAMLAGTAYKAATPAAAANVPKIDDLVESTRKLWATDIVSSTRDLWERERIENDTRTRAEDEARRQADLEQLDRSRRPPPLSREQALEASERNAPPIQNPQREPQRPDDVSGQVQASVNAISHFAHMFGPVGSAFAGATNSVTALPGVAQGLGATAPALVTAAPYVAAAGAVLAVPVAAAYTVNAVEQTVRAQVQGLSVAASQSEAEAQVRALLANIRTADRLGDEVASYVRSRSQLGAATQGIRDVIAEPILQQFNKDLESLAKIAGNLNKASQENSGAVNAVMKAFQYGTPIGQLYTMASAMLGSTAAALPQVTPAQVSAGLMGIVPVRPTLPAPFSGDKRGPDDSHVQMPGL